jgi:signal transduction histidine kinase
MPATASGPAQAAFERLMARCAAALRAGSALAGAAALLVGIGPPARLVPVLAAAVALLAWAGAYSWWLLTRGWSRWLAGADIAVAATLCLAGSALLPAAVAGDGSSGVFVAASATVIIGQLGPVPPLGVAATTVVSAAHVAGLRLGPHPTTSAFSLILVLQGVLVGGLMVVLRRSARAADAALAEQESARRDAAVQAARRDEEREHFRLLHDSVSATLTVIAAGGLPASTPALRAQASRDLRVVERLQDPATAVPPPRAPGPYVDLGHSLAPVAATAGPALVIEAAAALSVPAEVGAALAAAVAEALTNVARHAQATGARLRVVPVGGGARIELVDDGRGFDPAQVPAHRRGLRESVVARMHAIGGTAAITSAPGQGTRVVLHWPADLARTDLAGADLAGADLARTDLAGTDLAGTDRTPTRPGPAQPAPGAETTPPQPAPEQPATGAARD